MIALHPPPPQGGSFSWGTNTNAISLNSYLGTTTYTAANPSNSTGDTAISVSYTMNFQSSQATSLAITVQAPTVMAFDRVVSSNQDSSCPSNQAGWDKVIDWQVRDQMQPINNPINMEIPTYDTIENVVPNSCFTPQWGQGTAPGNTTNTNGIWEHHYTLCSTACVNNGNCSVNGTQHYFVAGVSIDLPFTMTCQGITVNGH